MPCTQDRMNTTYAWKVILLGSLSFIISAQACKWLDQNQEEQTRQILHTFNQMVLAEETSQICQKDTSYLPVIDSLCITLSVESAAIAVREVADQTIQFYRRNQKRLDYHQPAWERLQELVHYQNQQLSDCIPKGAENQLFIQAISQRFNTLQRFLEEQEDEVCAQRTAHVEIRRNLLMASQLSSCMKKRYLKSRLTQL